MAVEKITRFVKVGFTEQEATDLLIQCAHADRTPSEFVRLHMRSLLYGIVKRQVPQQEWANSEPVELS